jgi:hypothetical protein
MICWCAAGLCLRGIQSLSSLPMALRKISEEKARAERSYLFTIPLKHYRNPNLTHKGRRQLLLSVFIGVAMLARGILLLRAS